ncbi:AfsR family transcriptional regulator, partial [Streptomyces sp. TRM76130]|nr:AfsR family transcriptional regulator [Streptomyces sp. TRM76130]
AIERPGDRLVDHLAATAYPGLAFPDRHAARDWLYAEADTLLACVRQSARGPALARAVDLLWAAKDLAESGADAERYEVVALALRDAAQRTGDPGVLSRALTTLTNVHLVAGR